MADKREQAKWISRALQMAESSTSDVKAAHGTAGNLREAKLLLELLSDTQRTRYGWKRLAKAKGVEQWG